MSWSFVLPTVIYNSFSFIDVYEQEHKMILKCSLIETAVDTVTVITDGPSAVWGPWIKVYFPLVLEAAHYVLKKQLGWSEEMRPFIFIGGRQGASDTPTAGFLTFKDSFSHYEEVLLK